MAQNCLNFLFFLAFKKAATIKTTYHKYWLDSPWSGFFEGKDPLKMGVTGVHEETLTHIGKRFASGPPNAEDFIIHKSMIRILKVRYSEKATKIFSKNFTMYFVLTLLKVRMKFWFLQISQRVNFFDRFLP